MPRLLFDKKFYFFVECEGLTEQAYIDFLKNEFKDVATFRYPKNPGTTHLFQDAEARLKKDPVFKNQVETIDEIWLFFDVEDQDWDKWNARWATISRLRKLRGGRKGIPVRLLMTSGCLEYWFLLHYENVCQQVHEKQEKAAILERLRKHVPIYTKWQKESIAQIAQNYQAAILRGEQTIKALKDKGIPELEDTDDRNCWLLQHSRDITFTTVHEAVQFLEGLRKKQQK